MYCFFPMRMYLLQSLLLKKKKWLMKVISNLTLYKGHKIAIVSSKGWEEAKQDHECGKMRTLEEGRHEIQRPVRIVRDR